MPKSGTSALYFYLNHHPQLVLHHKESCALNKNVHDATPGTLQPDHVYFESLPPIEKVCPQCLVGEACISLGLLDSAAYKTLAPSLSTVFLLLRNPVRHMYASYWFWCTREETNAEIPGCCDGQDKWNPRKNVTYTKDGEEQWYDFPRSVEDFGKRVRESLAACADVNCPEFIFHMHITYVKTLHATFGKALHIIPTERLYSDTETVWQGITAMLGVAEHDFGEVASLSVNVNGNLGMDTLQSKSTGEFPS